MKKQKVISAIVSVAAAFGGLGIVPVSAAEVPGGGQGSITEQYANASFIDIARKGDTYVAMAKTDGGTGYRAYTSTDGGLTWGAPVVATVSGAAGGGGINVDSQNQIVYWPAADKFVFHTPSGYSRVSSDGITWESNTEYYLSSNGGIAVSGDYLIAAGYRDGNTVASFINTADANMVDVMWKSDKYKAYPTAVAATPVDENGNITAMIGGQSLLLTVTRSSDGTVTMSSEFNAPAIASMIDDMIYAESAGQFLFLNGDKLTAAKDAVTRVDMTAAQIDPSLAPDEGEELTVSVTAIGANDNYIAVGLSNGTIYYTAATEITSSTQWTKITEPTNKIGEPITNIVFDDDTSDSFVALSSKKIIKGDTSLYCNIYDYVAEYRNISDPYVTTETQENPFEGVRLIGGAYSPTLDKYVVYGDTTEKLPNEDGVESYWGMIFTSDDGLTWERVYQGYTFSQRNMDKEDTNKVASYTEVRNGAVWWENEGIFIISASTMDHTGVSLVSSDGENWSAVLTQGNTDAEGNPTPEKDTGLPLNVDIALGGDGNLYVGGSGRRVWKYMAWNIESREETLLTDVISGQWYLNQLSVSDEADPAILTYQNAEGAVKDNDSGTWTAMANIASGGLLTDSVYSGSLNSFVAVSGSGHRTSIVSKDGSVAQGPVVPGGVVCKAIDTNDEVFMLAGQDGNVYTAADTAEFASSSLTAVASANGSTNTMPLTNVFKAGEMFIATASDNTDSDVLAISKNAETGSYEYVTASSLIGPGEMAPGSTVNVCVDVDNQLNEVCTFTLISAVFSADKRCVQINTYDASVDARVKETVTMPVEIGADVPEGSTMRLFVWDSLEGMVPLTDVSVPFN